MDELEAFSSNCKRCERLSDFLSEVKQKHPDYFCAPVPSFGAVDARLLIVGLAPGMHGANATGRPFTGDVAGVLLYETLHRFGFSSRAESVSSDDGLILNNCRITNAVRCLPPQNKPVGAEVNNCNDYLKTEIMRLDAGSLVVSLGSIAHRAVIRACGLKQSEFRFGHGAEHQIGQGLTMIDSYHCSRYNTQTKRLTTAMFEEIFAVAKQRLG